MSVKSAEGPQGSGFKPTQYVIASVFTNKKDKPVS